MARLVTNSQRLHTARQIMESVSEEANTVYYVFTADHSNHESSGISELYDNLLTTEVNVYDNMIFGKKVEQEDVKLMIRNVPYVSNTVYAMFDDTDETLLEKDYFVVVNASSFYHVFKCLDNNQGNTSSIEPNFSHITGSNTYVYQTSDGYRWKYMYSVDSANTNKFSSEDLFPYIANNDVSTDTIPGAIDVIAIDGEGEGYDNYLTGTFDSGAIRIGGNTLVYGVGNSIASSVNGFYTDCLLYISSGTGSGQYRRITDYFSNNDGKYMVVNTQFSTSPTNGSEYQIYPMVEIIGTGTETINAVARALVNAHASNSVYRVEMMDRGADYSSATATVLANSVVAVESIALVRPISGPFNGHGYDAAEELGSRHVAISVTIANTESNTIPIENKFQQIGLLRDPLFSNVLIETADKFGVFTMGETVYEIAPIQVGTNATINSISTTISCDTADFENQFGDGDAILFKSSNGSSYHLATIDTITNSSSLELTSNGYFACTETFIYIPNCKANAIISASNSSHMRLANVNGQPLVNSMFVGALSGAKATVNAIFRNDVEKSFDTYVQLYKYTGTLNSGTFEENEVIYQGNSTAIIHSARDESGVFTLYTSNQFGRFEVDQQVVGNTSGAIATITEAFAPELVSRSGDILFLENINGVTRSANTSETLQIIFEY